MDDVLASGMAKLAKTEHPIAVPRHKHSLPSLRDEAARLQRVLREGDQIVVKQGLRLQGVPAWAAGAIRWLSKPFLKNTLQHRAPAEELLRSKLDALQENIRNLDTQMLEGVLTPLTLAEDAECNAYYYKTRRHLEVTLPQETSPEGQKARDEAIEFTSNAYWLAKRVECALKQGTRQGDHTALAEPVARLLSVEQAHKIDPRVLADVWAEYRKAFELSEDELGKSAAPNKITAAPSKN
jgi:hypothetical protein